MSPAPTLRVERSLLREGVVHLACADEVGRGALSGPVTIGVVLITAETRTAPQGVRDSKLLSPEVRERLVPRIRRWAPAYAVGHASPAEIDAHGIMAALRLAGHRALAQLPVAPDAVLLDGNHDYLTPPAQGLLFAGLDADADVPCARGGPDVLAGEWIELPRVTTRIKADLTCAGVAAASVLAKTARDAIMRELHEEHPVYDWAENKGYSAPAHLAALAAHGPSAYHRRSWNLPGLAAGLAELGGRAGSPGVGLAGRAASAGIPRTPLGSES